MQHVLKAVELAFGYGRCDGAVVTTEWCVKKDGKHVSLRVNGNCAELVLFLS
jgi:hypothetical protein